MLYDVSIDETARVRRKVPYLIRMEPDQQPLILDEAQNVVNDFPPELRRAQMVAGMMGQMTYDPEGENARPTVRGGFYGVPLWLGSTSLRGAQAGQHPDKVWLVSDTMDFSSVGFVADHQFRNRGKHGYLPAAVYMLATGRLQLDRLHGSVGEVFDKERDDPLGDVLENLHPDDRLAFDNLVGRYCVRAAPFYEAEPGKMTSQGVKLIFNDRSEVLMGCDEALRINLSNMTFGMPTDRFVPFASECYRN